MNEFLFYIELGAKHVLDWNAYDHMLFLSAMALPFSFKNNRHLLFLVSAFTITHCTSLALSAYEVLTVNTRLIEFLIPVSIVAMAIFNAKYSQQKVERSQLLIHTIATALFGLIHGFGFSNYFKMLMGETQDKALGLVGFATGLEVAQLLIVTGVLLIGFLLVSAMGIKQKNYIVIGSLLVALLTLPLLYTTFTALISA